MSTRRAVLPFDVTEAAIQVAGRAFYYKSGLKRLFLRAGVPRSMFERYEHEMKFVIATNVFADLEAHGERGYPIAIGIVREMCAIRHISEENVNRASGLEAIERLRTLASANLIETAEDEAARKRRDEEEQKRVVSLTLKSATLKELHGRYAALLREQNPQQRGFDLERLLEDLFRANLLEYRGSFRTATQQIDGAFKFEKFDYLVEVKWTQHEATLEALNAFKAKVDRKIRKYERSLYFHGRVS